MSGYYTLTGRRYHTTLRDHLLHLWLPYGKWTCKDGREVLYNRWYEPIWQRINGVTTRADSREFVNWQHQEYFFYDGNPPWCDKRSLARCIGVLHHFGADWFLIQHYVDVQRAAADFDKERQNQFYGPTHFPARTKPIPDKPSL